MTLANDGEPAEPGLTQVASIVSSSGCSIVEPGDGGSRSRASQSPIVGGSGHGPPGARGATDEFGSEDHAAQRRASRPRRRRSRRSSHLVAHLLDRLADAGERRADGRGDRRVVEPDDRRRPRGRAGRPRQDAECAGGHQVGGGEDGVDVRAAASSCSIARAPPSWVKSPVGLEGRIGIAVGASARRIAVAGRAGRCRRPCRCGPVIVAMRRRPPSTRWLDGRPGAAPVVDVDVVRRRCPAADGRRRPSARRPAAGWRAGVVAVQADEDDAVDVPGRPGSRRCGASRRATSGISRTSWRSRADRAALTPRRGAGRTGR